MTTLSIRDLARNSSILDKYDFVEIVDKRKNKLKGVFISAKYAKEFEEFIKRKKEKEIKELLQFAGIANGEFEDMTSQKIKEKKREKYNG
ncbi:hypothetical protein [Caminibacter pacificus]|uniref:Uncharacterized protein n=1 Tax=Caminibacter pacificus TaxID=1424653 RepID=A0AAJ4RCG4_9BACT|nr:hypothetical protein [Caminibacter pacificus]QCI27924.1 hypothetical protein C6V80_02755 [Caminibacter pacificus]ROR39898.1 hypothetical protein EDC58_0877 [Caminibacter pacificus]